MATFEDLLAGREIHELTEEEVNEMIEAMSPEELDHANVELRKIRRAPKPSKRIQSSRDEREEAAKSLVQQAIANATKKDG